MPTAVSVYTTPPLRKLFDVTIGSAAETGTTTIAHGIDFTDVAASEVPLITQVHCIAAGAGGSGIVPYIWDINATNVTMGFNPSFAAGVVNVHIQRMHSIQG